MNCLLPQLVTVRPVRVPLAQWETNSTHGFGVSAERCPYFGYSLKARRDFERGCIITQYEGVCLTREEARDFPPYSMTHLLGFRGGKPTALISPSPQFLISPLCRCHRWIEGAGCGAWCRIVRKPQPSPERSLPQDGSRGVSSSY